MAYSVKYRLDFSSKQGGVVDYRLDIEQEGYSGTITDVIGAAEPISFEYITGQDIYEPIVGSKMDINLMVTDTLSYDDFSSLQDADGNLDARAYRVTLRYKDPDDASYTTYWRGFLTPQDSGTQETTTPYPISLTATDGLNLVLDEQVVAFNDANPKNETRVGEYIFDLVNQTGTQLPIRVYHDLRTTIDSNTEYAIVESTCNDYVFFDELFDNPKSKVEAAESILMGFNARLFQGGGAWNIISCSGHSATISSNEEDIAYKEYTYNTDTESWGDGVENTTTNVLLRVPNDFKPVSEDFVALYPKRGAFSVECHVDKQYGTPINNNGFFSEAVPVPGPANGPHWENKGLGKKVSGDAANYGTTRTTSGAVLGTHRLQTTRCNDSNGSDRRDVWFEVNVPYGDLEDLGQNLVIALEQNWTSSNIASATVGVSLALEYENNDYFVYNWESNVWDQRKLNRRTAWSRYWTHLETSNNNKGQLNFFNVGTGDASYSVRSFFDALATFSIGATDTLHIRIGDIKAYDSDGDRVDGTGLVTTSIDGVMLSNNVEDFEPFYERFQDKFRETLEYQTDVYTEGASGFRGKLGQTSFFRNGVSEDRSLEQLVTQQKLNDFRVPLKYYEGTLIGLSEGKPLFLTSKLLNDQTGGDTLSTIMKHFTWQVRSNTYNFSSYLPNQATDIGTDSANFSTTDVYPAVNDYTWRETIINFDIELDLTGVTLPSSGGLSATASAAAVGALSITVDDTTGFPDTGWLVIGSQHVRYGSRTSTAFASIPSEGTGSITTAIAASTSVVAGVGSYIDTGLTPYLNSNDEEEYGKYFFRYSNVAPDEPVRQIIDLVPTDDSLWEINGSNFSVSNADTIEAENISIVDPGTSIRISMDLETNDYSEEIQIQLSGEVDAFTSPHVTFSVTDESTGNTGINISHVNMAVVPQNATEFVIVYVTPVSGSNEILLANSSITVTAEDENDNALSGVIGSVSEVDYGTGVQYIIPVTATDDLDDIVFSVTATTSALPDGVTTSTITLNCTEAGSDSGNWSLQDTQLTATGVVGTNVEFFQEVNADPGYIITAVTAGSIEEAAHVSSRIKKITNYEWLSIQKCIFQAADATINMTLNATTSDDDGEEVDHTISTPDAGTGWSYVQNEDVTVGVDPGDTARVGITIEGDDGYDVSGLTCSEPAETWLTLTDTVPYKVSGTYTTGVTFWFEITGQAEAQTSAAIGISGTATKTNTVDLVMALDTTDSGIASVNKSFLKWTYSEADAGTTGDAMTFTVQSNNPLYSYVADTDFSAGQHFIEETQSGSATLGTFSVSKSRTNGVFTFTVTPTFGTAIPEDGRYDGYFVLSENVTPDDSLVVDATEADWTWINENFHRLNIGNPKEIKANVNANGNWRLVNAGTQPTGISYSPTSGGPGNTVVTISYSGTGNLSSVTAASQIQVRPADTSSSTNLAVSGAFAFYNAVVSETVYDSVLYNNFVTTNNLLVYVTE